MHPNEQLIHNFYDAFNKRDSDAMAACYHDDIAFDDPIFVGLKGAQVGAMWKMLTSRANDLEVVVSNVSADDDAGRAHWEATYIFSRTGRQVLNIIDAEFHFKDGKINRHRDSFSFWKWSRQALGLPGLLLGWIPFLQKKVQKQSADILAAYMQKQT